MVFIVLCSTEDLSRYARFRGVDPYFMGLPGTIAEVSAGSIWEYATYICKNAEAAELAKIDSDYGCNAETMEEWEQIITGHIADEILSYCCRTILEY